MWLDKFSNVLNHIAARLEWCLKAGSKMWTFIKKFIQGFRATMMHENNIDWCARILCIENTMWVEIKSALQKKSAECNVTYNALNPQRNIPNIWCYTGMIIQVKSTQYLFSGRCHQFACISIFIAMSCRIPPTQSICFFGSISSRSRLTFSILSFQSFTPSMCWICNHMYACASHSALNVGHKRTRLRSFFSVAEWNDPTSLIASFWTAQWRPPYFLPPLVCV